MPRLMIAMSRRPLEPDGLREALQARVRSFTRTNVNLKGMRGLLTGQLEEVFGKEPRHWMIRGIFPESDGSTKNLSAGQVSALLDWLGYLSIGDAFGRNTGTYAASAETEMARLEGEKVITEARIAAGQSSFLEARTRECACDEPCEKCIHPECESFGKEAV